MGRLAENLTPPYYAAVLNENQSGVKDEEHVAPADEMVTLAPRQPGFLGLETAQDKKGEPITVSYWKDIQAIEDWMVAGDDKINNRFGIGLADTCAIKVSHVEKAGQVPGPLAHLEPAPPESGLRGMGAFLLAGFNSLLGLLP